MQMCALDTCCWSNIFFVKIINAWNFPAAAANLVYYTTVGMAVVASILVHSGLKMDLT